MPALSLLRAHSLPAGRQGIKPSHPLYNMLILRRILFFIFLGLYLVLCPLLILYSLGYIFNPVKQKIAQTGLIYLSSIPQGADIYLEKSLYQQKTPASIGGLIPGEYKITLKKKGYKPWVQQASVKFARASTLGNIILIPKAWPIKKLLSGNFVKLVPLRGTDYCLIAGAQNLGSLAAYDCRKKEIIPLLPEESNLFDGSTPLTINPERAKRAEWVDLPVVSIFSVDNSPTFIIYGGTLWSRKYLYFNLKETRLEVLDISELIRKKPLSIEWSDSNRDKILAFYKNFLNLLDIESRSISPHYIDNIKGYGVYDKWVYILDEENNIFKQRYDNGLKKKTLIRNAQVALKPFGQTEIYKIKVLQSNIILFLNTKGELITNLAPYNLVDRGVTGMEFNKNNLELLYWTRQSIGIVDFSSKQEDEPLLKGRILKHNIIYTGRNITDCYWVNAGNHILFNDSNKLYLSQLQPQGSHIEPVTELKENSSFFYSENTGSVYYLEASSGNLNAIEIVPK